MDLFAESTTTSCFTFASKKPFERYNSIIASLSTEIFEESKYIGSSPKGVNEFRKTQTHIGVSLLSIFASSSEDEKKLFPLKFIDANSKS
jgi:hypothetical protein